MSTFERKSIRISANLPRSDFELLKRLSDDLSMTMTDVIRRGIRSEEFFQTVRKDDGDILVRNRDGTLSPVIEK